MSNFPLPYVHFVLGQGYIILKLSTSVCLFCVDIVKFCTSICPCTVRTFSHCHITHFLMSWSVNCKLISFSNPPLLYIHFQVEHVNIILKFASLACPFPDRASWNRCQIFHFCVSFFWSCNMNNCSIFMNFLYSVSWCSLLFHHIIIFSHSKKNVNGRLLWFFKVKMNNHLTYEVYSKQGN